MAEDGEKAAAASAGTGAEGQGGGGGGAAAAAAGKGGGGGEEERSVKLFVGQVPKHMTEPELLAMFREVAAVDEVTVIKDKVTKVSRGTDPCAPDLGSSTLARALPGRLSRARLF
jgi:CUG-BP- and ETR3-like factor